jgi:hypothetical protein
VFPANREIIREKRGFSRWRLSNQAHSVLFFLRDNRELHPGRSVAERSIDQGIETRKQGSRKADAGKCHPPDPDGGQSSGAGPLTAFELTGHADRPGQATA